MTVQCI